MKQFIYIYNYEMIFIMSFLHQSTPFVDDVLFETKSFIWIISASASDSTAINNVQMTSEIRRFSHGSYSVVDDEIAMDSEAQGFCLDAQMFFGPGGMPCFLSHNLKINALLQLIGAIIVVERRHI